MPNQPLTIDDVNRLDETDFVKTFGDIAEHSPWVARAAYVNGPFADREALIAAFVGAVEKAGEPAKRALLIEHPDLAGRAAIAGKLAPESKSEQAGAGLDRMSAEEYALFTRLNSAYRARHGFPFIRAVKGSTKSDIIAAFQERVGNPPDQEFATAVSQVQRILRFRLEDRVAP